MRRYIDADARDVTATSTSVPYRYRQNLDVVEVAHGEWIYKGRDPRIEQIYKCSVCERYNWEKSNYCPNCGAEMRERREDD